MSPHELGENGISRDSAARRTINRRMGAKHFRRTERGIAI
jgi:hypothetical protein